MAPRFKFSKPTKPAHPQKKGPPIFLNKVFAITGDFGLKNTHESIKRWISYHSGQVRGEVTKETTHLICSIEDYKKKAPHGKLSPFLAVLPHPNLIRTFLTVKKALTLGKRKCHIVVFDWLVDCLVRKSGQRVRSLSEKPYLMETVLKRVRMAEKAKVRHTEEYIANIKSTTELADPRESAPPSKFLDV
jgi:BRCA1 C Terminus (BRCT) domain